VTKRVRVVALVGLFCMLAVAAAGCGGSSSSSSSGGGNTSGGNAGGGGNVQALPSSFCSDIYYEGSGSPDFIVATDLPLQGAGRAQTTEMVEAAKYALKQRNFKAGKYNIAMQSCDDSTAQTGGWDSAKCASNARAYAGNKSIIGVVGTFNSGCAKIIVPVLNRANPGPIPMVSPANTNVGLTQGGPGTEAGEPDKYYPTGQRNYARVVADDNVQGAADATWAKSLGKKKIFVLNDKQTYGYGVAFSFRRAAKALGLDVVGFQGWDAKQSSYEALANSIKQSGADAVFLGGIICNNGAKLIKDLKQGVPNATLIAPDGFSDPKSNGAAFDGSYASVAGAPPSALKGEGAAFVKAFSKQIGATPNPYSAYGAQAMDVMLDAISKSDGTRASVTKNLFGAKITNGILGTFSINQNGDTTLKPITIYKQQSGELKPQKTITPPPSLVS
jgi:branched-chain amino acid transport system substrate-binding protein